MCTSVMPLAECFPHGVDDFVDRVFKSMRIAFLRGEGAELAGEHADVGVVDVAIENVGRDVAVFSLPHGAGHDPESVEVIRSVKLQARPASEIRSSILDFFSNRAEFVRGISEKFMKYARPAGKARCRLMMHRAMRATQVNLHAPR